MPILQKWREGRRVEAALCMQVALPGASSNECFTKVEVEGCLDCQVNKPNGRVLQYILPYTWYEL